jgi:hypothetical protein
MPRPLTLALTIALAFTFTAAHAAPIPPDKLAYVGEWEGHGVTLIVTESGSVTLKKAYGGSNTSMSGLFSAFEGNDIKVSVFVTTFTVKIQEAPYQDRGVWLMTVEGAKVLRKSGGVTKPRPKD